MIVYKQSKYVVSQKIENGAILCSNFLSGKHIILSEQVFKLFNGGAEQLDFLMHSNPKVFNRLMEGLFIIDTNIDEFSIIKDNMVKNIKDNSLYHIIINPTLDCNLSCWYCYENKVPHSKMSKEIEDGICKHIAEQYNSNHFNVLKLSFFGGEPLLYPEIIIKIVSFAKEFCVRKSLGLIFDFTTNGTLLSMEVLNTIKDYPCFFQITLDGNRMKHNKIKYSKDIPDTFSATINNIYLIQKTTPKSITSVRINFDSSTLLYFDEILSELDMLDRLRTKIILKKVWQINSSAISKKKIFEIINQTLDKEFSLDYYSQGGICFADRDNQITFNYDGGVYKCTTITHYDKKNSLGTFHASTGLVSWDDEKISYLKNYDIFKDCKSCKLLPLCGGPCRKKIRTWNRDDCFLRELEISIEEYALIQLKIELTNQKIRQKYEKF